MLLELSAMKLWSNVLKRRRTTRVDGAHIVQFLVVGLVPVVPPPVVTTPFKIDCECCKAIVVCLSIRMLLLL